MNKIKQRIIDLCMDDSLDGEALVIALESEITQIIPYNPNAPTDLTSCGINDGYIRLELPRKGGQMCKLVEGIENSTTKRKLAIAYFRSLVDQGHALSISEDDLDLDESDLIAKLKGTTNPLKDTVSSLFSSDVEEEDFSKSEKLDLLKKSFKELFERMLQHDTDDDECHAEDDSDCWKCKSKSTCNKFKN